MKPSLVMLSLSLSLLSACAPLHPHTSAWGDAGEVAGRVLLCPLTLCTSELILQKEHEADEQRFAYARWYNSLSLEARAHEDQREAVLRRPSLGRRFPAPAAPSEHGPISIVRDYCRRIRTFHVPEARLIAPPVSFCTRILTVFAALT